MFEAILEVRPPEGVTLPGPSEGAEWSREQPGIDPRETAYPTQ